MSVIVPCCTDENCVVQDLLSAMAAEVRDEQQINDAIKNLQLEIEQLEESMPNRRDDADAIDQVSFDQTANKRHIYLT